MKRQHPLALLGYTTKNFWLLLIPLLRGLASLRFDFAKWAQGAGWDILAVVLIFAIACIRWYFTRYKITESGISVKSGIWAVRHFVLSFENVTAAACEQNLIYQKAGAVRVHIDSDAAASGRDKADISLVVPVSDRAVIINSLRRTFEDGQSSISRRYKVSKSELIWFSLLFSSAVSGVVLFITALSGGTKIVGRQLESELMNIVNTLSEAAAAFLERIVTGISPAGIAVSVIIAVGFFLSFAANILRHASFTITRKGRFILITNGFFTKRMYCLNSSRINAIDMRQNLLMKVFGIVSLHISCTGYGKRKSEFPVFIPISTARRLWGKEMTSGIMKLLLPEFKISESYIASCAMRIWRFIAAPSLLIFGIIGMRLLMTMRYPEWYELISFMTILCEIPAVWLLLAKSAAYCTGGINISETGVCAKYSRFYEFHTINVPLERVAEIRIHQSIFQRLNKSCDVIIYTNAEYVGGRRIKSLPIREVQELIRERFHI